MVRFRIVRYLSALIPFVIALASPLSEPLKRQFLSQYDLRWYASQEPDKDGRRQLLAVHNAGSAEIPKVVVELGVETQTPGAVADFYFSPLETEPQTSFLNTLTGSDQLTKLAPAEKDRIAEVIDEHFAYRSLRNMETALEDNLKIQLRANKASSQAVDDLQKTGFDCDAWHQYWLRKCPPSRTTDPSCNQVNKLLETWEQSKRNLYEDASKRWREATGVSVKFPSSDVSSVRKTFFMLPLSAGESGFLTVNYGPDPVKSSTKVFSSSLNKAIRVDDLVDLRASPLWIFLKKHPLLTVIFTVAFVLSIFVVWHVVKPYKLRPIYRMFNLALQTRDHEFWEHVNQRHRYYILQQFRYFRELFNKPGLNLDSEEILDFVRTALSNRYRLNKRLYKNEKDLNRYIRNQIRFLVLNA